MPDWMFNGASFVQPAEGVYSVDQLTAYTASVRYDHEIAGTIVGGIQVRTDRESQGMINGAYNMAARDASFSTQWKTTTGAFMTLDAATIIAVAQAVGAHVAACFAKEAATVAAISAGSITTLAQVDAAFA
jgi:hypothetical protein